jgi:hypothetical protein
MGGLQLSPEPARPESANAASPVRGTTRGFYHSGAVLHGPPSVSPSTCLGSLPQYLPGQGLHAGLPVSGPPIGEPVGDLAEGSRV